MMREPWLTYIVTSGKPLSKAMPQVENPIFSLVPYEVEKINVVVEENLTIAKRGRLSRQETQHRIHK